MVYGMDLRNDNAWNMLRKYVILCTVQLSLTGRTGVSMAFSRQKYESMRKIEKNPNDFVRLNKFINFGQDFGKQ